MPPPLKKTASNGGRGGEIFCEKFVPNQVEIDD